jgi:hypothetical protein
MAITQERYDYVANLVESALNGSGKAQGAIKDEIHAARGVEVEEAHSTSDFPSVLRSITEAAFLSQYGQIESVYPQYTRQYNVNNLRPQSFYSLAFDLSNLPDTNGGKTTIKESPGGLPRIPELTEFPEFSFSASSTSFGVAKFGARVGFSFEMLLNDEWGVLESLPTELAQLARNQEDIVATEVVASPTGPNSTFFSNANGNIFNTTNGYSSNNPALTVDALEEAMSHIRTRTYNGNPVVVPSFSLMVPPALEAEARRLLGVTAFEITDPQNGVYTYANPVSGVNLIVNPWLPVIDKSATVNTTWYVLPTGSAGIRPAVVFSKIRGRGEPELRIAAATGNYLGGGEVPGREGSFLNDDIEFRVRHFVGAAGIAFETAVVSKGNAQA